MLSRKHFLRHLAGLPLLAGLGTQATAEAARATELPLWPLPDLTTTFREPVLIRSVELFKTQGQLLLVVTSDRGQRGITQCNDRMQNLTSLLQGLVMKHFVGQDARQLPQLVQNAYSLDSNYKYAGMPLWNCIGTVEIAVWDLLGKVAQKPVHELLGTARRTSYPVYLSSLDRNAPVEQILQQLADTLQQTHTNGVKIKIGGRLKNTPEDDARSVKMLSLARKILGDKVIIYADANGSFSVKDGIRYGKMLEDIGAEIFEEAVNFEDEEGMRAVNKALKKIVLAGGEQDTSLYRFQRLAQTSVYDLLQPDVYYNGGILRTLQVAEIARLAGKTVAPHSPKADPLIAPFWQVAAVCPNLFGLQEYPVAFAARQASWYTPAIRLAADGTMPIPQTPGLGLEYDEGIWKKAEKLC
ncbi:mandelate racemase/muconate lactonizing enzyme family protein [Rhabdobacter roseus]|uniref:L-alanine-DL-glutamate epimerase-like enolase superfamily enzyme n=1 Tax=Rhabdobacter roseus TaxID=1655419 RepID=A0A840TLV7_9BACT|nr:mandelate racemase/muconate lactonizing enzyme family protein [Rhabdobacter roseus]MBB5284571.1 L-alanine-DL-glutamate epimerase-like enolase superfamily enzyme [Rhabdobacter roseus]